MVLSRNGKSDSDGNFDWKDALIDAGIVAGLSFCTTLGGLGATGLLADPSLGVYSAAIAAATQFFVFLAIKRGLKEKA